MSQKIALLQVADTGPLESLVLMLESVGYVCVLPSSQLKDEVRKLGCDTVLDVDYLVTQWGYDRPIPLYAISPKDLPGIDIYVDVKAHRNGPKLLKKWPSLADKILWYRINGGKPEITERGGDEIHLDFPILTPNRWYGETTLDGAPAPWTGKAYSCWPPFYRFDEYKGRSPSPSGSPICLTHNLAGWGYGQLINPIRQLGVRCYGVGSPDGLVSHSTVPKLLEEALALVHLKSNDAPGYSLYESLAAGCPLIVPERLIWRCKMEELLIPGETCLTFDKVPESLADPEFFSRCTEEINAHLEYLSTPENNRRIGSNGRRKLLELMWSSDRLDHVDSLQNFFRVNFRQ